MFFISFLDGRMKHFVKCPMDTNIYRHSCRVEYDVDIGLPNLTQHILEMHGGSEVLHVNKTINMEMITHVFYMKTAFFNDLDPAIRNHVFSTLTSDTAIEVEPMVLLPPTSSTTSVPPM